MQDAALLDDDEPAPATLNNTNGKSVFLLVCDHASNALPRRLGTLGLQSADLHRHIAWDIGASAVTRLMADQLDACAILQSYSRLAIDCNRPPDSDFAFVDASDGTGIPGNDSISLIDKALRVNEIFQPYHNCIDGVLNHRQKTGASTALISLHSFTLVLDGQRRPDIAVMYNRDRRLADQLMK